ncbi:MAG: hypothetical protein ACNS62_03865 [Candidatus Cyclobacteriaceae bacterium M3_2C_046]
MKIPSLIRTPKNKRFNFEPRYYDPVREEIKDRTDRIRKQITNEDAGIYESQISKSFARRSRSHAKSNVTQLALVVLMATLTFGYIFYGNIALYLFLFITAIYIYLRIKRIL